MAVQSSVEIAIVMAIKTIAAPNFDPLLQPSLLHTLQWSSSLPSERQGSYGVHVLKTSSSSEIERKINEIIRMA